MLHYKRIYEPYDKSDGTRILVDRLWPRGVKKSDAHVDIWLKDIAPSKELRVYFHQDKVKHFSLFKRRYLKELEMNPTTIDAVQLVENKMDEDDVTLVYAAKDPVYNHVDTLYAYINKDKKMK